MSRFADILAFLRNADDRGERTALVTLTAVTGSSSRAPGTHMAVSESGAFEGSFSGGCVEAAVVGEARRIIGDGRARHIRFGVGSPYIDIRLPCGGGIDLLFTPNPPRPVLDRAATALDTRQPVALLLDTNGSLEIDTDDARPPHHVCETFTVRHDPALRLVIVGHGAETLTLARLAATYGASISVLTPDRSIREALLGAGIATHALVTPARSPHLTSDAHSAIVFLFHDHEWEIDLMRQALGQDAFFVGAMGSRATHRLRRHRLVQTGLPHEVIARLVGPIGLIPATRDPDTLALSVLGQIVERYHARVRGRPAMTCSSDAAVGGPSGECRMTRAMRFPTH